MYENQFIRFFETEEEALESHVGHHVEGYDLVIHLDAEDEQAYLYVNGQYEGVFYMSHGVCTIPAEAFEAIGMHDGDIIKLQRQDRYTTNGIVFHKTTNGLAHLQYRCYENCFGFPFVSGYRADAWVQINLKSPQYSQSDKTYTKSDGSIITLYSQARKEWEGETEYLTEDEHDKIMIALMCDEVYINGKRVSKSASYDIDWESHDTLCDGTKAAKATFKVQENMVSRNSNY